MERMVTGKKRKKKLKETQRARSARLTDELQATFMVDKTCLDTEYYTPASVLDPVKEYFGEFYRMGPFIGLDPANAESNPTGAVRYYTKKTDGLRATWSRGGAGAEGIVLTTLPPPAVFLNPPFGEELRAWLLKLYSETTEHRVHVVALLPGQRFEQEYFQHRVFSDALVAFCAVRKRVAFLGEDGKKRVGNPYGSFLYLFNGDSRLFGRIVSRIGMVIPVGHVYRPPGTEGEGENASLGGSGDPVRRKRRKKQRKR